MERKKMLFDFFFFFSSSYVTERLALKSVNFSIKQPQALMTHTG